MPPTLKDIQTIIINAIDMIYGMGGFIFLGLLLMIGFQWMTSQNEDKKMADLKERAKRWIIGIILFFLSATIVKSLYDGLGVVDCNKCPVTPGFNLVKNKACLNPPPDKCPN